MLNQKLTDQDYLSIKDQLNINDNAASKIVEDLNKKLDENDTLIANYKQKAANLENENRK